MIYEHPHPYTSLLTHLKSHLPNSGPLLHCLQYQLAHPSPTAHILATFPPPLGEGNTQGATHPQTDTEPWLAAYVDIYNRHQTQTWIFSSIETTLNQSQSQSQHPPVNHTEPPLLQAQRDQTRDQLLDLLALIRTELIPPYLDSLAASARASAATGTATTGEPEPEPGLEASATTSNSTAETPTPNGKTDPPIKKIQPHPPTCFLIGSLHTALADLIAELHPKVRVPRQDASYVKYCFDADSLVNPANPRNGIAKTNGNHSDDGNDAGVIRGYRLRSLQGKAGLQPHQAERVISRTHIPRSAQWLLAMQSVVLYPATAEGDIEGQGEMPIAWGFLSSDGSLCSLHVEEGHRGKGLGDFITREVMRLAIEEGGGCGWGFSDVARANPASRKVMEKIGGKARWEVAWTVVDLI